MFTKCVISSTCFVDVTQACEAKPHIMQHFYINTLFMYYLLLIYLQNEQSMKSDQNTQCHINLLKMYLLI